jgi:hypothetical protein
MQQQIQEIVKNRKSSALFEETIEEVNQILEHELAGINQQQKQELMFAEHESEIQKENDKR